MGQGESTPERGQSRGGSSGSSGVAFHVLRVAERSPAAEAGIEPFFDFLAGINGQPLGDEIDSLTAILEANEGRTMILQVWSTKRKELRDVSLVPSTEWSTRGLPKTLGARDSRPSLLGLSLRVCNPKHALEQVWHILEILEGSPAESAGLVPYGDWIVGYAGGVLRGEGDFYDVVEAHLDQPLRLFVYNADYDVTRETILVPNRSWGANTNQSGLLGCGVGYGLLHRIPRPQDHMRAVIEEENGYEEEMRARMERDQLEKQRRNLEREDGYEEAGYDQGGFGGFAASEGVEIVANEEEEVIETSPYRENGTRNGYESNGNSSGYQNQPKPVSRGMV